MFASPAAIALAVLALPGQSGQQPTVENIGTTVGQDAGLGWVLQPREYATFDQETADRYRVSEPAIEPAAFSYSMGTAEPVLPESRTFVREWVRRTPWSFVLDSGRTVIEAGYFGVWTDFDMPFMTRYGRFDVPGEEVINEAQVLARYGLRESVELRLFGTAGSYNGRGHRCDLHKTVVRAGNLLTIAAYMI